MRNGKQQLSRAVVALAAMTIAGLALAAWNFVEISYDGATATSVFGSNDRGFAVGFSGLPDGTSVSWIYDSRAQAFIDLPPWPDHTPIAMGINSAGVITGFVHIVTDPTDPADPGVHEGFILKNGIYTTFSYPGHEHTYPRGIGRTGLITGYTLDDDTGETIGFIYDSSRLTFTDIVFDGMVQIIPQGINARGRVVGSVYLGPGSAYAGSPPGQYGFLRESSGATTLFRVDGKATRARSINDAGAIAGFVQMTSGLQGFIGRLTSLGGYQVITNAEFVAFPSAGAQHTYIESIDNSGRIAGSWVDIDGIGNGFVATSAPKARP